MLTLHVYDHMNKNIRVFVMFDYVRIHVGVVAYYSVWYTLEFFSFKMHVMPGMTITFSVRCHPAYTQS